MSQFTLTLNTDNAVPSNMTQATYAEVSRILTNLADNLMSFDRQPNGALRDHNGNTVGSWTYTPDAEPEELNAFIKRLAIDMTADRRSRCALTGFDGTDWGREARHWICTFRRLGAVAPVAFCYSQGSGHTRRRPTRSTCWIASGRTFPAS